MNSLSDGIEDHKSKTVKHELLHFFATFHHFCNFTVDKKKLDSKTVLVKLKFELSI